MNSFLIRRFLIMVRDSLVASIMNDIRYRTLNLLWQRLLDRQRHIAGITAVLGMSLTYPRSLNERRGLSRCLIGTRLFTKLSVNNSPVLRRRNIDRTHRQRSLSPQLPLQPPRKRPRHARLVRVELINYSAEAEDAGDEGAQQHEAEARLVVGVGFGRKDAQDVVVLVDGLAVVAALLLVPPVGVGVAELALDGWGVDVAAVLWGGG